MKLTLITLTSLMAIALAAPQGTPESLAVAGDKVSRAACKGHNGMLLFAMSIQAELIDTCSPPSQGLGLQVLLLLWGVWKLPWVYVVYW